MNRMRVALVRKIVPGSAVAALLFCTPLPLAAQEREPRAADQVSTIEWFAGVWSDFTAWLDGEILPPPSGPDRPTEGLDSGCIVDPHGGCWG